MAIRILDCTLRDGGYINDWKFSDRQILQIVSSLEKSNIDIIECGYLNAENGKASDSTLFDSLPSAERILAASNNKAEKVIMINLGDYDPALLPSRNDSTISGIRLAFHKDRLESALEAADTIQKHGYDVYFQPMITKNYTDIEFLSMIQKVNILKPYAFYIVDSFGSMSLEEFNKYLILAHHNLADFISLGYHSHNNMQLAFSNAVSMCNAHIKRDLLIDASIYGIGRGAGNLNTELIADYLNKVLQASYDTLPLLEVIDTFLNSMMKKTPWGFSPAQYLSALFNCHPHYATYLINKNTNHIVGIKKILEKLPDTKKVSFDKAFVEQLYNDSILDIKTPVTDGIKFKQEDKILLLASGKSIERFSETIREKIHQNRYTVIALNHKPNIDCDYYFFTNQKRLDEFQGQLPSYKLIMTSNLSSDLIPAAVLDFASLSYVDDKLITNVAVILINYLILSGIKQVEIAGLDGYRFGNENYYYDEKSTINDDQELALQNNLLSFSITQLRKKIAIHFVTPSLFEGC